MEGNLKVMKKTKGIFAVLILISLLVMTIFLVRNANPNTGPKACPLPVVSTPLITTAYPYPLQEMQPNSPAYKKFTGPGCLYDSAKGLAVWLPKGWYGDSSPNVIYISNYDPDGLQFQHGKALNMPADHIKIEIYVFEINPEKSIDQIVSEEKERSSSSALKYTLSENTPFKLGRYEGVTYNITNLADWNSRAITVRVNESNAISLQLFPADSPAYADAINILSLMNASANP